MRRGIAAYAAGALIASALVSACGGGGGDAAPPVPPAPTALPDSLSISAPTGLDTAAPIAFRQSIATPGGGLKFAWTFGDGATSTEASPSYSYPKAGDYDVTLKVTNEAGSTREAKYRVNVSSKARLKGLVCSGAEESGWCWENPRPTGTSRFDAFFLDARTGWMVGGNGEIFKTSDAGVSWVRQVSGITSTLTSIRFADAQHGWAVGEYGAFLRTSDGGTTWQLSKLSPEQNYGAASFQLFSADKLLLTDSGTSYASTDDGRSWIRLEAPAIAASTLSAIWTIENGALYKSTDMGATKTKVLDQVSNYDGQLMAVGEATVLFGRWNQSYDNNTSSWVYSYALKVSKDGGGTWESISPKGLPLNVPPRILQVAGGGMLAISGTSLYRSLDGGNNWQPASAPGAETYVDAYSFQVIDTNTLAYTRNYNGQNSYFTEDAGATWTVIKPIESANYNGAQIRKSGAGIWLARMDSSYYLSADKGKTWSFAAGAPSRQLNENVLASWFFDSKRGLLVTTLGELKETSDAGQTWTVKLNELGNGYLGSAKLQFVSPKLGWLSVGDGRLYRSVDGGASWSSGPSATLTADFQFIDESLGWARRSSNNDLLQTKDGGQSWVKSGEWPSASTSFRFRDANKGLVGGFNGQIYQTTDGGKTWLARYSGIGDQVFQLQYVDDKLVWALSNSALLRSSDGGESWTVHRPSSPYGGWRAMYFVDAQHGWVVGTYGSIAATEDGGRTWIQQSASTTKNLSSVQFIDAKTGWIMGEQGTVLATGTGGN